MKWFFTPFLYLVAAFLLASCDAQATPISGLAEHGPIINTSARSAAPLGFEENKGQVITTAGEPAPFVRYRLTDGNTSIFLMDGGIAYQFNRRHYPEGYAALEKDSRYDPAKQRELNGLRKEASLETFRMDVLLEGADPDARITTEGRSEDYTQYYNHPGSSPGQAPLDVHTYSRVTYHEVYPGIDWVVYTTAKGIEYDFVLQPGADPARIQLHFKDHEELRVDANGQLIHGNRMGRFTEQRPVSFQNDKEVDSHFVLDGDRLSFALGAYDHGQGLTIDPARIWGTYYGGSGSDAAVSCAVDASGDVYLAGTAGSSSAIASGGYQNSIGGNKDAFLAKFNSSGVRQWATYYGGTAFDSGLSCAVDGSGNSYLAGITESTSAIASGGQQNIIGGGEDAFLVKFNTDGLRLWGTYCGGAAVDFAYSCATDGSGNVYLAGYTGSTDGIASAGQQNTLAGGTYDAFLVKFNSSGVRQWGTYYGGTAFDQGFSCAADGSGNVYLAGLTASTDGIASGGFQDTYGGGDNEAFLVKFNTDGVRQWGTYYGGMGGEYGNSCAVDGNGNVYLAGQTSSSNAIASVGQQNTYGGGAYDAFLVKFSSSGARQWGTYYGGTEEDQANCCVTDLSGTVYLTGLTASSTAIAASGYQNTNGGGYDAFLVKFNTDGVRQWGTYYGGTGSDTGYGCALDVSGSVYLAGSTDSDDVIASGGQQNTRGGVLDGFLVKTDGGEITTAILSPQGSVQSFAIWPNPNAGDRFYLQAQGSDLAELEVFDALGKLQHTEQLQLLPGHVPVEVALGSALAKGLYIVRVTVEGRASVAPLVVE